MGLGNYVLKRLLLLIPVLLGVSIVVFLLMKITPGDPVTVLLPPEAQTAENIRRLEQRLGLGEPIYVQYLNWLESAVQGDLGQSYRTRQAVTQMVGAAIWPTVQLALVAFIVATTIAIPMGVLGAVYKDTWIDHVGRLVAFLGISMPSFWLGIMVILVFSLFWQGWFVFQLIPSGGYASPSDGLVEWLRHVLPPGITLGVGYAALTARLTRSSMVEVLNEEFVETARAKGVKERAVVLVHTFRNSLIPVVTVMGLQIGFLMNGAIVVEQVFQWPGIGLLLYESVTRGDIPLLQGVVLFVAIVFVFSNLVVDVLYAYLDPRIKYE
jgi:peptide/nickel transport system permease protein